MQKYQNKKKNI